MERMCVERVSSRSKLISFPLPAMFVCTFTSLALCEFYHLSSAIFDRSPAPFCCCCFTTEPAKVWLNHTDMAVDGRPPHASSSTAAAGGGGSATVTSCSNSGSNRAELADYSDGATGQDTTAVAPTPHRWHFLTRCGTVWAGCLRDKARHCWTMFTKRKKG